MFQLLSDTYPALYRPGCKDFHGQSALGHRITQSFSIAWALGYCFHLTIKIIFDTLREPIIPRVRDFNELLSEELHDASFAREYFLAKMTEVDGEQGLSFFETLKHVIRVMGVKEYARPIGMERQNVSRIIAQKDPPKVETLNRMLEPFALKIELKIRAMA